MMQGGGERTETDDVIMLAAYFVEEHVAGEPGIIFSGGIPGINLAFQIGVKNFDINGWIEMAKKGG
jgi:hypothetical protein